MNHDLINDLEKYLDCKNNNLSLKEFGNISFLIPIFLFKINFGDFEFNKIFNECLNSSKNDLKIQKISYRNNLNLKDFYSD